VPLSPERGYGEFSTTTPRAAPLEETGLNVPQARYIQI
jgi:hypothetical protein